MEDTDENIYSFDPYSIFLVKEAPCHVVKVKVLCGRDITKGKLQDAQCPDSDNPVDTPDPYVKVHIPTSQSPQCQTAHKQNTRNPEWNEEFTFFIDPEVKSVLKVELWESDPLIDDVLDIQDYDLDLLTLGELTKVTIKFKKKCEVDLEVHKFKSEKPDLRHGLTLCDQEKEFLKHRKRKVFDAMRDILGEESPENLAEVPVIGVLASGGGLRATIGFSGVISALHEVRILDMVTYISGLSGSSWYIGQLYSNPDWPDRDPGSLQARLKENLKSSAVKTLLNPLFVNKFRDEMNEKKRSGQPVTIPDYIGHLLGATLLKDQMDVRLSYQREKVQDGAVPLPLYTAIRVKPKVPATKYHEWVEYSPFEICMHEHGISLLPELLNSKFYLGRLVEKFPEPKLHYLLGMFGSAYAIILSRLASNNFYEGSTKSLSQTDSPESKLEGPDDSDDSDDSDEDPSPDDNMNDKGNDESQPPIPVICVKSPEQISSEQEAQSNDNTSSLPSPSSPAPATEKTKQSSSKSGKDKVSLGQKVFDSILKSKALRSRKRRAARVHNFLSGMKLPAPHAFFPFTPTAKVPEGDADLTDSRTLFMVDAGLSINLPIPPLVKPQRQVDLMISFDFSAQDADNEFPFQDLLETEEWARQHGVPFPPITVTKESVSKEGIKECYVFRDPQNDLCPILVHFVLINDSFRRFKRPGVPRETKEEKSFGDFPIFDDEDETYGTWNMSYTEKAFDRLSKLMAYNTLNHAEVIHGAIIECVNRRRQKAKTGGMPWEVSRISSMGAVNFTYLEKKADICNEGLEKVEVLLGKKDNDVYLRRYRLPRMEGMLEDAPDSTDEESLTCAILENEGDDASSVKEEEEEYQGIGGECGCGDEDCCHNPEEEVERVIQMRKASQGQSSYRNDTAELQERASSRKAFSYEVCCTVL